LEAIAYGHALGGSVTAVVLGACDKAELESLGKFGAKKVVHVPDEKLNSGVIQVYASAIAQVMQQENADTLIMANSSLATPVAARASVKLGASLITNVTQLPNGNTFKRSIYTGKAFANVESKNAKRIITLKKNAAEAKETGGAAEIVTFKAILSDSDFAAKTVSSEKATGEVLLPEAEIVVSGGRGMKGPEHWGMLEELAKTLHAATGCSKPVSDLGWRPHHEHVGQTGVKVAPQLYIAIGISGAIQHLAGVNSSKYIVVINKDADCPFFKAADYGIVGDAFDVVPKLTAALKSAG
jgi:electron transfer flavoprotein alpha subunit